MVESPVTILIVDSGDVSRNYLATILGNKGYSIFTADSGREGLIQAWQHLPQMIIIDPALPDIKAEELIYRLRHDRRTAMVPCIALSTSNELSERSHLLSIGFNEYLVKSKQALVDLLNLIPRLLQVESKSKKGGLLFVFLSAKGGVGTSSLCANIAMIIGKTIPSKQIAVIDMVLPIGSITHIVGNNKGMNIATVSALEPTQTTPFYYKENLSKPQGWNFSLLAGSPDPDSANKLVVSRLEDIVSGMLEAFDYIVVDLGRSLSRISLPIIHKADLIALVLSNDVAAVALSRTVWDYLRTQNVGEKRVYSILNRAVGLEGLTKVEAEEQLGLMIRATLPYMGGNFTLANNRHEPIVSKFPSDSATFELLKIASEMSELGQQLRNQP